MGALGNLIILQLGANQIGDAGVQALAGAIASGGVLDNLEWFNLEDNEFGDAGMTALAGVIWALPGLVENPALKAACQAVGMRLG